MCPYEKCSTRSLVCTIVVAFYSAVATRGLPVKRFGEQSSLLFIARLYLQPSNPPNFTETSSNLCCAAMATTETMFTDRSDFDYDYETLRTTGLVLAIIMFVSGILIALILTHLAVKSQRQRFLRKLYRKCCSNGSKYSLTRTDSGYERSFLLYNFVNWMINKQGFGKASQFYRVFFGIHKELCEYYKDDHDSRCRIKHSNETELSPRYKCN
ncbi:FXYD domain containing ion transport regulator 7 isoform X1 [Cynoglossus semilaevis]|uniref:FXYD domain containing ion transport regulator 7 isoform X1 n=1 Tax=Cynoglossus semilaevis TaxID=244447 RepID=UPI000495C850|nr:uncharacterized protein LOC103388498 isoform X1 [Cynoglossus semilaevis]